MMDATYGVMANELVQQTTDISATYFRTCKKKILTYVDDSALSIKIKRGVIYFEIIYIYIYSESDLIPSIFISIYNYVPFIHVCKRLLPLETKNGSFHFD